MLAPPLLPNLCGIRDVDGVCRASVSGSWGRRRLARWTAREGDAADDASEAERLAERRQPLRVLAPDLRSRGLVDGVAEEVALGWCAFPCGVLEVKVAAADGVGAGLRCGQLVNPAGSDPSNSCVGFADDEVASAPALDKGYGEAGSECACVTDRAGDASYPGMQTSAPCAAGSQALSDCRGEW